MKTGKLAAATWLRVLAVVLGLFALGHTVGATSSKVTRGLQERLVLGAMQGFRFPVMGFDRSYWDFYRGFAIFISVLMFVTAVVAWQLAPISQRNPRAALPMAVTLLVGCIGMLVVSLKFFFAAPIVFSAISMGVAGWVVVLLRREARGG